MPVIFITSGTSYTIPADCNLADVECIGGGGGGSASDTSNDGAGGGAGSYSKQTGIALTPNASVSIQVGGGGSGATITGGTGGDTWFVSTATVLAKGGNGAVSATRGFGGSGGVGTIKYAGGNGGICSNVGNGSTGGGGAAGLNGDGKNGGSNPSWGSGSGGGAGSGGGVGGAASSNNGANGGIAFDGTAGGLGSSSGANGGTGSHGSGAGGASGGGVSQGGIGGDGIEWTATAGGTAGSGGGGGGGGDSTRGGNAGLYGAGGGGGGYIATGGKVGGNGAPGIIVLTYTPSSVDTISTLTPDADSIDGSWTNELGGTILAGSIDEASAGDSDYIISSDRPVSDVCKISLSNPAGGIKSPVTVSYRFKKQGNQPINFQVRLLQGTTQIAAWTHVGITTSFVTATQTLTGGEVASITNPTDLFLEFDASVLAIISGAASAAGIGLTTGASPAATVVTISTGVVADTAHIAWGNVGTQFSKVAQSFTATGTSVKAIRFRLAKDGSPTDDIRVMIYTTVGTGVGEPGVQVGVTSSTIAGTAIATTPAYANYEFTFSTPVPVTNGVKYHAVLERTGALDSGNLYRLVVDMNNPYASGNAISYYQDISAWIAGALTTYDWFCEIDLYV